MGHRETEGPQRERAVTFQRESGGSVTFRRERAPTRAREGIARAPFARAMGISSLRLSLIHI